MQYRPEIDGLRAIAVIPVILFHAGFTLFGGGFVGVDIFFVISGYLISAILMEELKDDKFSILKFYERRARRILPALFFVMITCLPFAYMWMSPQQLKDFSESLIAVVFSASNIFFWLENDYFGEAAELKPMLHTWSLAVEEQFYLLFPILLMAFWKIGRSRLLLAIIILSIMSLALSEWGTKNAPSATFYLAPMRAWELLAGAICAFLTNDENKRSSNVLSITGMLLVLVSIFAYDEKTAFPGINALIPVIGTALVIVYASKDTWIGKALSWQGFVGIGLISYSAYLWHQPLFAFARLRSLTEPTQEVMAFLAILSLLLAWGTWHWVENAFRKGKKNILSTQKKVFSLSAAMGILFVSIGIAGYAGDGFKFRSINGTTFELLDKRLSINSGLSDECSSITYDSVECRTSNTPNTLLWGDSYAMHLAKGIMASDNNIRLQQLTLSACAPILGVAHIGGTRTKGWAEECIKFNDDVLEWIKDEGTIELVILSSAFGGVVGNTNTLLTKNGVQNNNVKNELVLQHLRTTVRAIEQTGAKVIIVSPTPRSGWDNGQCAMRSAMFNKDPSLCDFVYNANVKSLDLLKSIQEETAIYWLHEDICHDGICDSIHDGVFIFRDTGHLSEEGSKYLGRHNNWMEEFRKAVD